MQLLDNLCLLLSTYMDPSDGQNPVLDSGGSQQKGAGSVFQSDESQVSDLKAEVGELRSGGIHPI